MGSRHFKVDGSEPFLFECKKETERYERAILIQERAETLIVRLIQDAEQNPGYAAKDRLFAELLAHPDYVIAGVAWRMITSRDTEIIEDEDGFPLEVIK